MSKELINRISILSVCLGVALIFALLGAGEKECITVYIATLIGLNLSNIAEAIRERPLCINVDKSFIEWVIENLKSKYYESENN